MRVLVTGGSGRLGRSTVAVLAARGHETVSVDARPGAAVAGVFQRTADLMDLSARTALFRESAPEAVVHLAGIAVPFGEPDERTLTVNTALAWSVLSEATAAGAQCAVAASSPTVYGYNHPSWAPLRLPLDEEHPIAPWHAYGLSKAVVEETVRALARSSDGCVLSAVRPGYVITPEEWDGALTQQGHTVRERLRDPALAGASLFNYVDAEDAALLIALLVENPDRARNGGVYNAVAPDPLCPGPVDTLLARLHPATAPFAGALADGRAVFSSERARAELGWRPEGTWRSRLRTGD
ncbi:NAD-dependent epimerase/dehydratase family protein [Nocardiopsis xinjiangensis]|uniref:NAD-dependent epimerase/dehydratase family protein n=1 Tax=Nocardiopsis xinjiangensis TaxID=124285 RepID=UPI00034AA93C|nr:NAD(P)-dependent oxidoreductase [Nocardiopsis xinjiangensis]